MVPLGPEMPVNIVFVGAGAVGCFYASRLHHPRHDIHVSLVARSNYRQLHESGVRLKTHTFGDYDFHPAAVYPSVQAAATPEKQWDFVIVTTKALPDRGDDAALIAPLIGPRSAIVLIQNGVGVEEPYRRRYSSTPITSGVALVSAEQVEPGTIRQDRWTRLHLGPYTDSASFMPPPTSHPDSHAQPAAARLTPAAQREEDLATRGTRATERLAAWLARHGGIRDVDVQDEVGLQTIRWHKLAINAALNPSSILGGGLGAADMAGDPQLRAHLAGVMKEIWEAAPKILGRPDPFRDLAPPEAILGSVARSPASRPSMLQDWEAGRPLELEVILGNPVSIARARGLELPRMQSLYALLRSLQARRDGERETVKNDEHRGKL